MLRFALLIPLFLLTACGGEAPNVPSNGTPAPAFKAERLSGGTLELPGDLAGKVVAIRFWADWCPYCRNEMAALNPLYADLKAQGMEMLAVNVAQGRDRIEPFVADLKIVYPVLFDPDGRIARSYGVSALPVTWFVDREGRLRGKIVGESTPDIFLARARELLGKPHGQ